MMDKLNQFADHLLGYLSGAEIFLSKQMPDFVTQFIAYETWKCQWTVEFTLAVLVILIVLQVIWIVLCFNDKMGSEPQFTFLITGAIGTVFLIWASDSYLELKKLEIAPKVYMVEHAKRLITPEHK